MSQKPNIKFRITVFALLTIILASALPVVTAQNTSGRSIPMSSGGDYRAFFPIAMQGYDAVLAAAIDEAMTRFSSHGVYSPKLSSITADGDWALGVFSAGVSMTDSSEGDTVFIVANRSGSTWKAVIEGDDDWSTLLAKAPTSVVSKSLSEYLLDQHAALTRGPSRVVSLPNLKLPWLPKDNPRSISGYLYNEGTHTKYGDNNAMDWGLVNNDVAAVAGGTVTYKVCSLPNVRNDSQGYGNYVQIDIGGGVLALFAHLQSCGDVNTGTWYPQGTVVGKSGTSGYSTGPHLHFALKDSNRNPILAEPISGYSPIQHGKPYYSDNGIQGTPVGRLEVTQALDLSNKLPNVNESIRATFRVKNVGGQALSIQQLAAGGRRGTDWNGDWADFPSVYNITLQPGQEYSYDQTRSFGVAGGYFAEPVVKISDWGGIANANRVSFSVTDGGRLNVVTALGLSSTTPNIGDSVVARFRVKNTGGKALIIEQMTAGGRRGTDWNGAWADFPSVVNITLQPGQEYAYEQSRTFGDVGGYFTEPVVKIGGKWGGVGGANRVQFNVISGGRLQVVEALSLSSLAPFTSDTVTARFKVKNVGNQLLTLDQLTAGGRRGSSWSDEWADFPSVFNVTLYPGQEYIYEQTRIFDTSGSYFSEPVVKLNGNWGGIGGANRITFSVRDGGRLQVIESLNLSSTSPTTSDQVRARFRIKNVGSQTLYIDQLTAGGRLGTDWSGAWADFPSVFNITLQPGEEYAYDQLRNFSVQGYYFAEPVVKLNGNWGGIGGANRITFNVRDGGRLQVIESLSLSTTSPKTGDQVRARFRIKNVGSQTIYIDQLTAGGRLGTDWNGAWADFLSVFNITLQPGEEYTYDQQRMFLINGNYFAEPVVKLAGNWGGIDSANRVTFEVLMGGHLQISEPLSLSTLNPGTGETVWAHFKVKNTGVQAVTIDQIQAAGRHGADWNGDWADFPSVTSITLLPGNEYSYDQQRVFNVQGDYFHEPYVIVNGTAIPVEGTNRVTFNVGPGIALSNNVSLIPSNPSVGQNVVATFVVKNLATHPITIQRLLAGGRGPNCTDWLCNNFADFPSSTDNITIQPNQEFTYSQSQVFYAAGSGYFVEPLMLTSMGWFSIIGGSRVNYSVH